MKRLYVAIAEVCLGFCFVLFWYVWFGLVCLVLICFYRVELFVCLRVCFVFRTVYIISVVPLSCWQHCLSDVLKTNLSQSLWMVV